MLKLQASKQADQKAGLKGDTIQPSVSSRLQNGCTLNRKGPAYGPFCLMIVYSHYKNP